MTLRALFHPRAPGRGGFTLLEALIVLAIIAVLGAALVPFLNQFFESAVQDTSLTELRTIYQAIVGDQQKTFGYVGDVGDYPASLLDLVVSPGLPGWNGPYLPQARVENTLVLDAYARPYEYRLLDSLAGADQLAVISGGPNRTSTNTAANPNVAANFTGTVPTDPAYFTQAGNADNQVFPDPTSASGINVTTDNLFALNIQNFDANSKVNAFVPGCPNLYQISVTSIPRNSNDVNNMLWAPGFAVILPQGTYQYTVVSQNTSAVLANEKFAQLPGVATTRSLNLTGLDSSATPSFTLTATNQGAAELEVFEFTTKIGSSIKTGETKTYTVHACAQVFIRNKSTSAVVDSFVMPFSNFTRFVAGSTATLTVTNNTVKDKLDVYNNGLFIGQVKKGKAKTFTDGLDTGDTVTVFNHKTGALLQTKILTAGANAITI